MTDLILLQPARSARGSLIAAFASVGVTVHVPGLAESKRDLPQSAPVAAVLRHPIERLGSHFNTRLRSGRPHHPEIWTDWEASIFTVLPTFNAWGEAITSTNEFFRSASDRAFVYWLKFHGTLKDEFKGQRAREVHVAGTTDDLPAAVASLAAFVGCDVPELPTDPAVIDPNPESLRTPLTDLAELGFRAQLAEEITLYERLLGRMR